MSHLIAIAYPNPEHAAKALDALKRLEADGAIALDDVAAISRDGDGGVKIDQVVGRAAKGAAGGFFLGALIGLIVFPPVILAGALFGAASGAVAGKMAGAGAAEDFDEFERQVAANLPAGAAAIVMVVRAQDHDRAVAGLRELGGTIIETTLPDDVENQLRAALGRLAPRSA
ncbi:MAG TPA: DUF1269 domain-containing protein [Thermomicrobiales bacterium]|nr:DUF1269 domain-containing protein [Thermomicrobiales bacterium]